jgi:hypothetical protein
MCHVDRFRVQRNAKRKPDDYKVLPLVCDFAAGDKSVRAGKSAFLLPIGLVVSLTYIIA